MGQKVFLSYDFNKKNLLEWFEKTVKEVGGEDAEVVVAPPDEPGSAREIVTERIDSCNVVFCFLTKRIQLDGGKFLPPTWVLSEAAYARSKPKRPVVAFKEAGI